MAEKKNPDYSASAVNLCNPAEVGRLLAILHEQRKTYDEAVTARNASIPEELQVRVIEAEAAVNSTADELRAAIEKHGSYQDLETGWYAVKQKRSSTTYDVAACKKQIPQFASAVIEETVNEKKIEGLLKGGLITKEDVAYFASKHDLAPAYIIK